MRSSGLSCAGSELGFDDPFWLRIFWNPIHQLQVQVPVHCAGAAGGNSNISQNSPRPRAWEENSSPVPQEIPALLGNIYLFLLYVSARDHHYRSLSLQDEIEQFSLCPQSPLTTMRLPRSLAQMEFPEKKPFPPPKKRVGSTLIWCSPNTAELSQPWGCRGAPYTEEYFF